MTWHSKYYPWTRRPPARCWRTPHRCAYQERLGGRHATIQDYEFRVIICFFLFCHLWYSISAYPKTHKPRERASDVSTISKCFSLMLSYTAHSPTNFFENGWGYHCRVLVRLLALYAKLNWFFATKKRSIDYSMYIKGGSIYSQFTDGDMLHVSYMSSRSSGIE